MSLFFWVHVARRSTNPSMIKIEMVNRVSSSSRHNKMWWKEKNKQDTKRIPAKSQNSRLSELKWLRNIHWNAPSNLTGDIFLHFSGNNAVSAEVDGQSFARTTTNKDVSASPWQRSRFLPSLTTSATLCFDSSALLAVPWKSNQRSREFNVPPMAFFILPYCCARPW